MNKVIFVTTGGLRLCGIWHIPDVRTDKAVVLAHGITTDKDEEGIFADLADKLCKEGFAAFRFDFRGHGESEGASVDMTISGELKDLDASIKEVETRGFNRIGLLGASFGGGIAVLFCAKHQSKLKSLCLWNPCLNYDHCFINPTLTWIRDKKAHMKKDLQTKGWTYLGSNKFRIGKQLFEEMGKTFPFEAMKKISIPTTIIHGDKDTYVPYEDSVTYLSNLMGPRKLVTIKSAQHGFQDDPHTWRLAVEHSLSFFKKYL